jgi:hypothetical protein
MSYIFHFPTGTLLQENLFSILQRWILYTNSQMSRKKGESARLGNKEVLPENIWDAYNQ